MNTYTYKIDGKNLSSAHDRDNDYDIIKIMMKDSVIHKIQGSEPKFFHDYSGCKDVVVYHDRILTSDSLNKHAALIKYTFLPVKDIKEITIKRTQVDNTRTLLYIFGGIILIPLLAWGIAYLNGDKIF